MKDKVQRYRHEACSNGQVLKQELKILDRQLANDKILDKKK